MATQWLDNEQFTRSSGKERSIRAGTVAFVHRSCLETWLGESNTTTCELCHQIFNTERVPRYTSAKSVWYWCWRSNGSAQDVRSDLVACAIITPLTIIITYVCLFSSEYYNQVKFSSVPAARWTSVSLLIMIGIMLIGYYMWVYSTIRMHARRWYNWWQRTCNVRYIPPGTARVVNMNLAEEVRGGRVDESSSSVPVADVATSINESEINHTSISNGVGETVV
ncbi:E3 ubiquitin-protein ligase MARCHF3-like [Diorhabda sublineata]|uniref:E3 ubiquitin-protein ligase MARCHF3-like n=1 Tax=Diorhabda sublineata TaxID=1163346 RepID=UPI0024E0F743|nr:E3 ubiquitin-protein ligase MARCHF3-like [Diorhabda sublineata]